MKIKKPTLKVGPRVEISIPVAWELMKAPSCRLQHYSHYAKRCQSFDVYEKYKLTFLNFSRNGGGQEKEEKLFDA